MGKALIVRKPIGLKRDFLIAAANANPVKDSMQAHIPIFNRVYKELLPFTDEGKNQPVDKETGKMKKPPVELSIDVIREFLINRAAVKPMLSAKTVFVIEEAQKLNKESQNAMLKTLEEPPPYCSIILLCTRLEDLLPTTQSRCQIVNFGSIDENIIVEKLRQSGIGKEEAQILGEIFAGQSWCGLAVVSRQNRRRKCFCN